MKERLEGMPRSSGTLPCIAAGASCVCASQRELEEVGTAGMTGPPLTFLGCQVAGRINLPLEAGEEGCPRWRSDVAAVAGSVEPVGADAPEEPSALGG